MYGADATDNSTNGVALDRLARRCAGISNHYQQLRRRIRTRRCGVVKSSPSDPNEFHGDVFGYLRDRDFQAVFRQHNVDCFSRCKRERRLRPIKKQDIFTSFFMK